MSEDTLSLEMQARLRCIMEPYQLDEFIRACEVARAAGDGWFAVALEFRPGSMDIEARFSRKPRPDQSGLLRQRSK